MSIVTGSIYLGICLLLLSNIAEANILVLVLVADWLLSTLNGGQSIGNLGITFISANCWIDENQVKQPSRYNESLSHAKKLGSF